MINEYLSRVITNIIESIELLNEKSFYHVVVPNFSVVFAGLLCGGYDICTWIVESIIENQRVNIYVSNVNKNAPFIANDELRMMGCEMS
jgi:hypothetical protein